jgi:hypothetical protein
MALPVLYDFVPGAHDISVSARRRTSSSVNAFSHPPSHIWSAKRSRLGRGFRLEG